MFVDGVFQFIDLGGYEATSCQFEVQICFFIGEREFKNYVKNEL